MKRLATAAMTVVLASCGASEATPPGQNPLLVNAVSKIQLYHWIEKANKQLDHDISGHSCMCRRYEIAQAKANALPEKARQSLQAEFDKQSKATCSDYERQLAPLVTNYSGLEISAADMKTPEVWVKFNRGQVAAVMGIKPRSSNKANRKINKKGTPFNPLRQSTPSTH